MSNQTVSSGSASHEADSPETEPVDVAADDQIPLIVTRRQDVQVHQYQDGIQSVWVIKDPISLRYYRFSPQEFAIFDLLNGRRTIGDIRAEFSRHFFPKELGLLDLRRFIDRLLRAGLVIVERSGRGRQFSSMAQRKRKMTFIGRFMNIVAFKFPGFHPRHLLDVIDPWFRPFSTRVGFAAGLILIFSAMILAMVRWETMVLRLPMLSEFFAIKNVLLMLGAFAAVKIVHELGHAIACRRMGIECREMGVMLLVFFPCLYCDVSDAWVLPKRWKRMIISLAGVYVELLVAAICTWFWWFSRPGLMSDLLLNLMVICSLNTLFLNGNPLMRYDGYYVLSDLVGIPNLRQQAWQQVFGTVVRWVTGMRIYDRPARLRKRSRVLLTVYGVAALIYRALIIFGISWMAIQFMKSNGMASLGRTYASILVGLTVIGFAFQLPPIFMRIWYSGWQRTTRSIFGFVLLAAILGTAIFVPVPARITGPCVVQPLNAKAVYATIPGMLESTTSAGKEVADGTIIARLSNPYLDEQLALLEADLKLDETRLENLLAGRRRDNTDGAAIPTVRKSISETIQQIAQRQAEMAQLTLKAPESGTILPPPNTLNEAKDNIELEQWSGTPLEMKNIGAFIPSGTLMCYVGSRSSLEIQALMQEYQIQQIRVGDPVQIQLRTPTREPLAGKVVEISRNAAETIPREIAISEKLMVETTAAGEYQPTDSYFTVRIHLDEPIDGIPMFQTGNVCVSTKWQSIATQAARYLGRQLAFEL